MAAAGRVRRCSWAAVNWYCGSSAGVAGPPGGWAVAETMAGRLEVNRTVTGWPGTGTAGSTPRTDRPASPAWSRGGRSWRPLAAGTTRQGPVATGTTTLPVESRMRNGPEAETTAPAAAGAGLAASGGFGAWPVLMATRTRAGSRAAGTRVGTMPP